MVAANYQAPRRGDAISIDFNPQAGHEQSGRRPALVLQLQMAAWSVGRS